MTQLTEREEKNLRGKHDEILALIQAAATADTAADCWRMLAEVSEACRHLARYAYDVEERVSREDLGL